MGLKAGLNAANIIGPMNDTDKYDRDRRLGFHAGLVANIEAVKGLSLQPELLYSTKGYEIDQTTTSQGPNNKTRTTVSEGLSRMKYLDLPLLVQLQTGQFYLEAGPQASFLLSQETRFHEVTTQPGLLGQPEPVTEIRTTTTVTENYKKPDMGYAAGLGFKSADNMFSFGLRYSHSMSSILKDAKTDARTSLLQVSVSSNLPFFGQ
jgi:Outer membrane protein beta-barrel domain